MKKFLIGLLLISMLMSCVGASASGYAEAESVILNGKSIYFDQPPIIIDGRTLVPVRALVEAMHGRVEWDATNEEVYIWLNDKYICLAIGSNVAYFNDKVKILDVPPQIISGRTLVPVRFISECFGFNVSWDADAESVIINDGNYAYTPADLAYEDFISGFNRVPLNFQADMYSPIPDAYDCLTSMQKLILHTFLDVDADGQDELVVSSKILSDEYSERGSCFSVWDYSDGVGVYKVLAKAGMINRGVWSYGFVEKNRQVYLLESTGLGNSAGEISQRNLYQIKDGLAVPYLTLIYNTIDGIYEVNGQSVSPDDALNVLIDIDSYNYVVNQVEE